MHGTIKKEEREILKGPPTAHATERDHPEREALLAGLVIDARGITMVPSGSASCRAARARYYVGTALSPRLGPPERIPATRLESGVAAILGRIRLLNANWRREDIKAILKQVVVLEDAIILQLDKTRSLTVWRERDPSLRRMANADVLRMIGSCLAKDEEFSEAGKTLSLRMPRHSRARKIRIRVPCHAPLFREVD